MNQVIERLLAVQELDAGRLALKAKLERGPARVREDEAELQRHRDRLAKASRHAKEAVRTAERKNADVDAADSKIKDLQLKQYAASTNREYQAFKTEIAGLKADREILEEEALLQWSVGDEREKEAAEEEISVGDLERRLLKTRREWEEEEEVLERELEALEKERVQMMRGLPPTWVRVYERVIERSGTPAMVPVVEQYCQGCQMNVSIHDMTRAWKGDEVVRCHACNRILYAETL